MYCTFREQQRTAFEMILESHKIIWSELYGFIQWYVKKRFEETIIDNTKKSLRVMVLWKGGFPSHSESESQIGSI